MDASVKKHNLFSILTNSLKAFDDKSATFKWIFLINKYIFILINALMLGYFLYLFILPAIEWNPDNALIILGMIFGIVLSFVALYGAFKEECYFILTYNLFTSVIYVISVYNSWRNLLEEISLFFYVIMCFLFAHLIYRKHPSIQRHFTVMLIMLSRCLRSSSNITYSLLNRFADCTFTCKRMEHTSEAKLVAVCQMNCKDNKEENFSTGEKLIRKAKKYGCSMAFLPECFDFMSSKKGVEIAETIDGPIITKYRQLARECKIWLSLGGFNEKIPNNDKRYISHLIINDQGELVAKYRKAHLFNLDLPNTRLLESETCIPGDRIEPPVNTPIGNIGLSICYDLRFPELAISLATSGADILTYPSAFTVPTGYAHWETLLRARAIENQCYVIAAGQVGYSYDKRSCYGHSMIIDPWGAVIAQCNDDIGIAVGLIDHEFRKKVKLRLPIWTDKRPDLYGNISVASFKTNIEDREFYEFGSAKIKPFQVFYKTNYSFAFVNHRPLLPGHSLISPLRSSAKRVKDLTAVECADLFSTIQRVEKALELEFKANSSLILIQDGPEAGQSIEHVHAHICPRSGTEKDVDSIYADFYKAEKDDSKLKHDEEVKILSYNLRKYF